MALGSLGIGETKAAYSVDVIIQSIGPVNIKYGDTMVAIPVYVNNEGFDTISGYSLYFTSGFPDLIDFVDNVDTVGSISSGFCFSSFVTVPDTAYAGDQITVTAHNIDTICSGKYIYPQTLGNLLFTLHVNISAICTYISDTNIAFISVFSGLSNISNNHGKSIPTPGETSAESLYYVDGYVNVPGTLVRGDVNGSCRGTPCAPTLSDVIHLVNYLFNKPPPLGWLPCPPEAADANCSGTPQNPNITLADVITIVNRIFKGIPFPCP